MDPFDAIENAIHAVHPDAELQFIQAVDARTYALNGFVVTRVEDPVPHWLIVSQGFTDLWDKDGDDPDVSGWGFELTCRAPAPTADMDFGWVVHWMQHVADYLAESGAFLEAFHHKSMAEPRHDAEICALLFVDDVALEPTRSRNGGFGFLQMVGLNSGELAALQSWDGRKFAELMKKHDPLLINDAKRASLMEDEAFAAAVAVGRERDGSSLGGRAGVDVMWFEQGDEIQVHLSHDAIAVFEHALTQRLAKGHPMLLVGNIERTNTIVVLEPAGRLFKRRAKVEQRGEHRGAVLPLSPKAQKELLDVLRQASRRQDVPHSLALETAKNLRFVVVDPATFGDVRYPF